MIHLLNGDALFEKSNLPGSVFVMREALCDGPVTNGTGDRFWSVRSQYMLNTYSIEYEKYNQITIQEFAAFLQASKTEQEVYLWFEWDLFCQVNFWFAIDQLTKQNFQSKIFWVQPPKKFGWRGFGPVKIVSESEMQSWSVMLGPDAMHYFLNLWQAYTSPDVKDWELFLKSPPESFGDLSPALEAEWDRRMGNKLGLIVDELIRDHGQVGFAQAFTEFFRNHGYYGFGDLQFQTLWNQRLQKPER